MRTIRHRRSIRRRRILPLFTAIVMCLSLMTASTLSQQKFPPVWSGTPYQAMNIYVTTATMNGIPLQSGDQIGIFDGANCVGSKTLTGPLSSSSLLSMIASTDDPTTSGIIDGFTPGHAIVFRFWRASVSEEITQVVPTFTTGGPLFSSLGTAVVSLAATTVSAAPLENLQAEPHGATLTAFPNPFNPTTTVSFIVRDPGDVNLAVYGVLGEEVRELVHGWYVAGSYAARWDGSDALGRVVPAGVYFVRLRTPNDAITVRVMHTK